MTDCDFRLTDFHSAR